MEIFKNQYPVFATVFFVVVILLAHLLSPSSYEWSRNTISDLGAQGYSKNFVMRIGLVGFGGLLVAGVLVNGPAPRTSLILLYGAAILVTGVFCAKPFLPSAEWSTREHQLHSLFAQIAGVAFILAMLVSTFTSPSNGERWIHVLFVLLVSICSGLFMFWTDRQGIAQRLLYLVSFIWLTRFYKP
jgi:hypothetical membrane protein